MLKRLWRYLSALFGAKLDEIEDPEILLSQAQKEMTEMHARNRERAVQAITQKNNLQQMVDDQQKRVDNLQSKAELALKRGDRDLALQLLKEKQQYETSLTTTKASLAQAVETVDAVKNAIRREEEQIRQKTAEALALKAQWKNSQIQIAMNKALDGLGQNSFEDMSRTFDRAQAKIRNANSESQARAEMAKTRVESRIADLDEAVGSSAAENELAQLEAKLGLSSNPAPVETTTTATTSADSDIERQLRELEAKVGGSGGSGNGTGGS